MPTVYVIDVDGTIAQNEHRAVHLVYQCLQCLNFEKGVVDPDGFLCTHCGCMDGKPTKESWDHFEDPKLVALDIPVLGAQAGIRALIAGGHPVHYLTARGPELYSTTHAWLQQHFNFDGIQQTLTTRSVASKESKQPAHEFKEEEVFKLKHTLDQQYSDYNLVFLDDHKDNLKMFSKHGIAFKAPEFWNLMHV